MEYNEWIEQAQFDYTEAMVKLEGLWDLCHVAESERRFAHAFNPSEYYVVHFGLCFISDIRCLACYDNLEEREQVWGEG